MGETQARQERECLLVGALILATPLVLILIGLMVWPTVDRWRIKRRRRRNNHYWRG